MRYLILPVLTETWMQQIVFLCIDRAGETSCICQTDFLIPTLFTHKILSLERIETRQIQIEVRQRQRDCRLLCILTEIDTWWQTKSDTWELRAPWHRRTTCCLCSWLRVIIRGQVVILIVRCRKVHTCRQLAIRIRLCILTMRPSQPEVRSLWIVGHSLVTITSVKIRGIKWAWVSVSLSIARSSWYSPRTLGIDFSR